MSLVGCIEIDKSLPSLSFKTDGCEQLDKPRTAHSLIYLDPFIYMIGGIVDSVPTSTCKRFHVKEKVWSDLASLKFYGALTSPAVIAEGDSIYVFDCYSETQSIFKYSAEFDAWETIPFVTQDFTIPRSIHASVFK